MHINVQYQILKVILIHQQNHQQKKRKINGKKKYGNSFVGVVYLKDEKLNNINPKVINPPHHLVTQNILNENWKMNVSQYMQNINMFTIILPPQISVKISNKYVSKYILHKSDRSDMIANNIFNESNINNMSLDVIIEKLKANTDSTALIHFKYSSQYVLSGFESNAGTDNIIEKSDFFLKINLCPSSTSNEYNIKPDIFVSDKYKHDIIDENSNNQFHKLLYIAEIFQSKIENIISNKCWPIKLSAVRTDVCLF
eukprot:399865_1